MQTSKEYSDETHGLLYKQVMFLICLSRKAYSQQLIANKLGIPIME